MDRLTPRQRQVLAWLGLPRWVPRQAPAAEAEPTAAPAPAEATPPPPVADAAPAAGASLAEVVAAAEEVPALDWPGLHAAIAACERCGLCRGRQRAVPGEGDRQAELLVVGEAPGAADEQAGRPFAGPSGQLLERMLGAIGLSREQVWLTNAVKCRPPEQRRPAAEEVAACRPWLQRELALVAPRAVLLLGGVAAQSLLARDDPVSELRGRQRLPGEGAPPAVVSWHPAYLLRRPAEKRGAWADLKQVMELLRDERRP